ncbi:hypothetical protein UA08_06785 [Talaromyces atroroseus]|uniref:FHA domain-containing protein n=1 Tax=Talaromyces atroroseus TaxID=1441469 RepID=A0A225AU24_TALAT|nr:hypothetical protein UA08_06785 [Talaromyces atroroseus]OKL57915.1 hypothetical protein UA08_06785 [Talaromyces atroroseus]
MHSEQVYSPDTLPFRSLTFSSNDDTIPIGRASKSEAKNLVPDHDNGWFSSRVMSRSHAVLSVRMEKQAVYIRDHGSLHGTQLNDNKIKPKENVNVKSGDVLTFGSEISRGTETFRPIAVRLDCQWHESKPVAKDTAKATTNTFSVPEDEDELIEVVDSKEVHDQPKTPQNVSDSSDLDYGSDMSRPLDLTSPVTSPEVKTSELPKSNPADSRQIDASQHDSALEGRDTKFISPESLGNEDNEDGSQFDSEDDDANSESDDSAGDQARGNHEDDLESNQSENDHSESNDLDEQNPTPGLYNYKRFRVMGFPTPPKRDDAPKPGSSQEFLLPEQSTSAAQPDLTADIRGPTSNPPVTSSANYTVPWPEYLIPRIPSPSDKAMAKPMSTPAPSYQPYSDYSSNFEIWTGNQGPSHASYADPVHMANPYGSITANESFPFGPHRSSGYLRHLAGDFLGEQAPPVSNEKPFELPNLRSNKENAATVKEVEKPAEPSKSRVSIADIVEKSFANTVVSNGLKRKADDFEMDMAGDSNETNGDSPDSIPDAQPRPDMQSIQVSQPQILDADSTRGVQPNRALEHRPKRIKTKEVHSFMKYATVAAIGAVVGSIGTIAGLASLPADFFN